MIVHCGVIAAQARGVARIVSGISDVTVSGSRSTWLGSQAMSMLTVTGPGSDVLPPCERTGLDAISQWNHDDR